ncbi:MAG: hypothetical protein DWQ37_10865 [Planctomycetota bacterium]|nr:MAG: hypothetical protein DWQ37_10865 [Planctomycetota bacterium]
MIMRMAAVAAVMLWGSVTLAADEYRVEKLEAGPPADALSAEIIEKLTPTGFRVLGEDDQVVCEVWPVKQLDVKPDFQPTLSILYPLKSGSLVGALHFPHKGTDFRGQEIESGTYTLRYGQQPQDGNHIGTFDTRDFVLMLPAAADRDPKTFEGEGFVETSGEASGSTHPAIIPLLEPLEGDEATLTHLEEPEWWVLHITSKDAEGKTVPVELIVVGESDE